jgi:hypothetical protein
MTLAKEIYCECCQLRPVEEPDVYTKCSHCLAKLAKGYNIVGGTMPHPLYTKHRGKLLRSIEVVPYEHSE